MRTEEIKFYISNGELIAHHIKESGKERIPLGARLEGEYFLKEKGGDIILPYGIMMAFLPLKKITTAKIVISSVTKNTAKKRWHNRHPKQEATFKDAPRKRS